MNIEFFKELTEHVPFYATEKYHSATFFDQLPIIDKNTVVENHSNFIQNCAINEKQITTVTSGSSGMPLKILWREMDYYTSLLQIWRHRIEFGIYPNDKFCSFHVATYIKNQICTNKVVINNNNLSLSKCYSNKETLRYYYEVLCDYSPKWMLVQPSYLYSFIIGIHNEGFRLPNSIKLIELTGEACSNDLLCWFKRNYPDINWKILYGMQEFNAIGYGSNNTFNILKDNVYVEVLDKQNQSCPPNQEGDIVISGRQNSYMPLIRYKTGDRGFINEQNMLVLTQAKSNDMVDFNGTQYDASIFWRIILDLNIIHNDAIKQFQIHLNDYTLTFKLVLNHSFDLDSCKSYIDDFLKMHYNSNYKINLQIVPNINAYDSKNKIKYFINWNN